MVSSVVLTILASYTILCVLLTLAVAAVALATLWKRSSSKLSATAYHSGELFVLARGAGNMWLIMWSFLGGINGAWMPATLGFYGYSYGLAGMLFFSTATALEPLICVVLSTSAYKQLRETNSLPESIGARYGHTLEAFTVMVMLVMTTLMLAAELGAVADIFESVMGIDRQVVLAAAALFLLYSMFVGGALVGLIMSQFNGMISVVAAVAVLGFFLDSAKHYEPPSAQVLRWGAGTAQASLLSFPGTAYPNVMFGAFMEVFWQKHTWCRQKSELWPAACYTGIIASAVGLLWGMAGVAAAWKDSAEGTSYYDGQLPFILYLDRCSLIIGACVVPRPLDVLAVTCTAPVEPPSEAPACCICCCYLIAWCMCVSMFYPHVAPPACIRLIPQCGQC
jgi:Na+/proline symporter